MALRFVPRSQRESYSQKKIPQQSTSTPVQNQLRSRPFASQPETDITQQQALPNLQTQLETARRLGHSFSKISAIIIQPKLTIGAVGDKYEQEADRVAQQVVQRINAPGDGRSQPEQPIQREAMPEDEERPMAPLADQIQRVDMPEEDEKLQMKPDGLQRETMLEEDELQMKPMLQRQTSEGALAATAELESSIQQSRGNGQALTESIRQPMEHAFGNVDFSGVNVHTDAQSDQLNRSIQAKAFTTGQDIFFRQGAYQPENRGGQELLAHELTHVVQQNGGAVQRSPLPQKHSATVTPLASVEGQAIQTYALTRAADGGNFVGVSAACHCHIDIRSPHFKVGKDQSTRINFGKDMSLERMQQAYNTMLAKHAGKTGYADCKEYLEEQGCVEQEPEDAVSILKSMLIKWGGLGEDKIFFYTDEGRVEERPVYSEDILNDTILEVEDEIRFSDNLYSDFLDEGSFLTSGMQDIDMDEMGEEQNVLYEKERKKVQGL